MTTLPKGTVYVVQKEPKTIEWLQRLLASSYIEVAAFRSAEHFLESRAVARPACFILDIRLPGMSGLQLQRKLNGEARGLAYIFFTETQDTASVVLAVKQGAIDFVGPMTSEEYLVELVHYALVKDLQRYQQERRLQTIMARLNLLSVRERQVLEGLVSGSTNRTIAAELGVCQKTIEMHRARLMRKMRADSLAELVRLYCESFQHLNGANDPGMIAGIRDQAGQLPLPFAGDGASVRMRSDDAWLLQRSIGA